MAGEEAYIPQKQREGSLCDGHPLGSDQKTFWRNESLWTGDTDKLQGYGKL